MMKAKFSIMIQYFFEDADMYLSAIREGIAEGDTEKIIVPAHTLKSASHQVGAAQMSGIAKEIERLARDQVGKCSDVQPFIPLVALLEKSVVETKSVLK